MASHQTHTGDFLPISRQPLAWSLLVMPVVFTLAVLAISGRISGQEIAQEPTEAAAAPNHPAGPAPASSVGCNITNRCGGRCSRSRQQVASDFQDPAAHSHAGRQAVRYGRDRGGCSASRPNAPIRQRADVLAESARRTRRDFRRGRAIVAARGLVRRLLRNSQEDASEASGGSRRATRSIRTPLKRRGGSSSNSTANTVSRRPASPCSKATSRRTVGRSS